MSEKVRHLIRMAHIALNGAPGAVDGANAAEGVGPDATVAEHRGLEVDPVVIVGDPVADEVVRGREGPDSRMLDAVRLR